MPVSPTLATPAVLGPVVLLTTFRRDGSPVATPVWMAMRHGHGSIVTLTTSGEYKRPRCCPRVTVASGGRRGQATGPVWAAAIRLPEGADAEVARAALLARFGWRARVLDIVRRRRRGQAAYLAPELGPAA